MRLEITDHRKIFTIQEEFSKEFPFLKIDFYAKPHTAKGSSPDKQVSHPAKTLGTCRTIHKKGFLTITPNMSVRDLQSTLSDVYGLSTKISRAHQDGWMDTAPKDGLSLGEHNKEGEISANTQQLS